MTTTSLILALHAEYERANLAFDLIDCAREPVPIGAPPESWSQDSLREQGLKMAEQDSDTARAAILRQVPKTFSEAAIFAYHAWIAIGCEKPSEESHDRAEHAAEVLFNFLMCEEEAGVEMEAFGKRFRDGTALVFERAQMRDARTVDGEPVEPGVSEPAPDATEARRDVLWGSRAKIFEGLTARAATSVEGLSHEFVEHLQDETIVQAWEEYAGLIRAGESDTPRTATLSNMLVELPATTPAAAAAKLKAALWTSADDWLADAILGNPPANFAQQLNMSQYSERIAWGLIQQLEAMG